MAFSSPVLGLQLHGAWPLSCASIASRADRDMVTVVPDTVTIQKNPNNGTWRVTFALRPDGSGRAVELRCFLRKTPHVLTETWSYLWNP